MESVSPPSSPSQIKCCDCGCSCSIMSRSLSGTCLRSVKRKYDEFEDEKPFTIPGLVVPQNARVEIENECHVLRETVVSQQQTIHNLISELEEERNAASSAANEAMSMILRLQGEKAEIQMEARQFKRFAEEKMAHDQQETLSLDDLLYKREQVIQSLTCEVEAYKHRMMSYGLTEAEAGGANGDMGLSRNTSMTENLEGPFQFPHYDIYPPLRININESGVYMDGDDEAASAADIEKYPSGESPNSLVRLKDLEFRINQLEKSPSNIQPHCESKNMLEKVIVGQSPRRHLRKFSTDSSNSLLPTVRKTGPDYSPKYGASFKKTELSHLDLNSNLRKVDNDALEVGDDMDDRVYTIDSIHERVSVNASLELEPKASVAVGGIEYLSTPQDSDLEIQKLYARLHALEADRESMRQSIISIGTDKAQLVLLKEIAQNLCKEMSPSRAMPVQKQSVVRSFSFMSLFKWALALVLWRRKARRCKYVFGLSANNAGLLMLLDQGPRVGQWRSITSTDIENEKELH